ncbi:MAG: glycoside hydrolase family 32 protein [Christensenellales bacterium]|jgi:fructan beta-fructosidase
MAFTETYRPQFHFTPPQGWMNDPNGLVYADGVYHLFYQHYPHGKDWGPMHWGHATSGDMIHWQHQPIALYPDDELGMIFSGSGLYLEPGRAPALLPEGGLAFFFTHHTPGGVERQSVATSVDNGVTLTKFAGNPVIDNDQIKDFRDPKVFWHADSGKWVMAVGGGPLCFYNSDDLVHWQLVSKRHDIQTECPDIFPLSQNGRTWWVLSSCGTHYYLGNFDGRNFDVVEGPIRLDGGDSFYAVQSFDHVPDGRRVWIGWMNGAAKGPTDPWRCAMAVPRELSLAETPLGLRLIQRPVAELEALRGAPERLEMTRIHGQDNLSLAVDSHQCDVKVRFECAGKPQCVGVKVLRTETCETLVGYDGIRGGIFVDRTYSGVQDYRPDFKRRLFVAYPWLGDTLELRVLADQSALEVYGPDGVMITCDAYPTGEKKRPVQVFSATDAVVCCEAYPMGSIYR